jgi:hypothetical protein
MCFPNARDQMPASASPLPAAFATACTAPSSSHNDTGPCGNMVLFLWTWCPCLNIGLLAFHSAGHEAVC